MSAPILSFRPDTPGLQVDLDKLVSSRLLIQADSGGGKSRMIRSGAEQLHGRIQQIILDPEGEFATLRERFDFLLAGRDGDLPTDPKTAKLLARRLLELGASAIVDLYDLKLPQRRTYVRLFLEELMHLPHKLWRPLVVWIDEAHTYVPQGAEAESSDAVITLCTQGRKRGYCAILATQRISKIDKDAAAELKNRLIGSTGLDLDMKRAGDDLGFDKEQRLELRQLESGHFWAYGPAISRQPVLVRGADVLTTHPQPGKISPPTPPPPTAVRKVLVQMQDLQHEAEEEARTVADLQTQLARVRAELKKAQRGVPVATKDHVLLRDAETAMRKAESALLRQADADKREVERAHAAETRQLRAQVAELGKRINQVGAHLVRAIEVTQLEIPAIVAASPANSGNGGKPPADSLPFAKKATPVAPAVARNTPARPPRVAREITESGESIRGGERAVLTAACQYPDGVTREQLSILTGYTRSSRNTFIQRLGARGLVEVRGDLVVAAEGAEAELGDFEPLPTGSALQEYWLERLKGGEQVILQSLLDAFPEGLTRDAISEATEYTRSSRNTFIQRLGARKLTQVSGSTVFAAPFLFDE